LHSPPRERQRRRFSTRDGDLRAGRNVLEQRREHVQTGRIAHRVQIVEHEHQWALDRCQRAPQARDALGPDGFRRTRQRLERLGRDRLDAVNGGRDVAQEHQNVVVTAVERDPRERTRIRPGPLPEQRCLAVPGGRDDGRERHRRRAQPRDRIRLRHRPRPARRPGQLDLYKVERGFRKDHRDQTMMLLLAGSTAPISACPFEWGTCGSISLDRRVVEEVDCSRRGRPRHPAFDLP
jgi:hypothetical protein